MNRVFQILARSGVGLFTVFPLPLFCIVQGFRGTCLMCPFGYGDRLILSSCPAVYLCVCMCSLHVPQSALGGQPEPVGRKLSDNECNSKLREVFGFPLCKILEESAAQALHIFSNRSCFIKRRRAVSAGWGFVGFPFGPEPDAPQAPKLAAFGRVILEPTVAGFVGAQRYWLRRRTISFSRRRQFDTYGFEIRPGSCEQKVRAPG